MLEALVQGTTDPALLAELARGRLRGKLPALRQALHLNRRQIGRTVSTTRRGASYLFDHRSALFWYLPDLTPFVLWH